MTAKEFLAEEEYTEEEQGEGYILTIKEISELMEEYAKHEATQFGHWLAWNKCTPQWGEMFMYRNKLYLVSELYEIFNNEK